MSRMLHQTFFGPPCNDKKKNKKSPRHLVQHFLVSTNASVVNDCRIPHCDEDCDFSSYLVIGKQKGALYEVRTRKLRNLISPCASDLQQCAS